MSKWWSQFKSKMWSPRPDEYTKLKMALKDLEYHMNVAIRYEFLKPELLEEYKKVFKQIQEGRNHLPPNDATSLQIRIRGFLTHFKNYGFEEIPLNTEQPQNCVPQKPVVVTSYGKWTKSPDSQKCEEIEMKSPTDQFRNANEPKRLPKRNNDTPSVHQSLPKQQIPPGMSYHQKRTLMQGGSKPEDVDEQKQKIAKDVNLQNRPFLRGGYNTEDVEEETQKITKHVNLQDVRDIEAKMIQQAQNEEEKNSNLQTTKHRNRNTDDRMVTRQRMEEENTRVLRPCQRDKHVETGNTNQITTRLQHKEYQNRCCQSQYEENMRQKRVQDENDRDDLGHFRRQSTEEVANRRCYSDEKYVEPQDNYQGVTTNLNWNTQCQQDKNEYELLYNKEKSNEEEICHEVSRRLKHIQDQNQYKRQDKEEENRRSYNDSKEYTEHQNIHHGVVTRPKDLQHQQVQYYDEKLIEDSTRKQNMCHGVTTRQKQIQHQQDQNQYKSQDNENKAFKEENRRSYNDSKKYTEHQNIQHGVATRPKDIQYQQEQYYNEKLIEYSTRKQNICHGVTTRQKHIQHQDQSEYKRQNNEEKNRSSYNVSEEYTEQQNIQHGVSTRQSHMQYQQDPNQCNQENKRIYPKLRGGGDSRGFRNLYSEEKALEEKNRSSCNVSREYTEQQNIHHGVTTRQNQQQQYYDNNMLTEEENRRRHSHQKKYLEAQDINQGVITRQSHMQYNQGQNQYKEENSGIYYENYDRRHKQKSGGDSYATDPHSEEYYIQTAREDGTYDRYREAAVQTSPSHQVRGRGRTHNHSRYYQPVEIETSPQEVEEPLEILDVHQYFQDDFDLKTLDASIDTLTQIETVEKWSRTFEDKVNNFSEAKFSLEYFVIDEKLMRMIEHLDKLKCKDDPEGTKRKIQVIGYIKNLQTTLDKRAIDE